MVEGLLLESMNQKIDQNKSHVGYGKDIIPDWRDKFHPEARDLIDYNPWFK